MKHILLGLILLGTSSTLAAQDELLMIKDNSAGLREGKISVIDVNNEGKYNVIFAGRSNKAVSDKVYIFRSEGDGTFTSVDNTVPFPGGQWISTAWEDVNGDGKIDLFTSGIRGEGGGNYTSLFTNNGDGTFTDNWELDLPQYAPGSAAADFDNDGIVDFAIYGYKTGGKLMFRNADGTTAESVNILPEGVTDFGDANITLVDINNDGFLDFYLCGYVHDAAKRRYSGLFINNGDRTFTESSVLEAGKSSNQATTLFADLDGDGWMDMVFFGHEGSGSMYVYLNIEGELIEAAKVNGIYQTKTVTNSGVLADVDNDGLYDLVANVYNGMNNNPRERLFFFMGTGDNVDFFELNEEMSSKYMGASNGAVSVFDSNNDGVLDFAVMGYNFSQNANDAFCAIYKNSSYTASNQAPSAPASLANAVDNKNVVLTWGDASDDKTPVASLSYNLYLKNKTTGKFYRTPKADLSTGRRLVYEHGNAYLAKTTSFNNLPDGDYEWSVQAIDAAYAGGAFAPMGQFTIGEGSSLETIAAEELINVSVDAQKNIVVASESNVIEIALHDVNGRLLQVETNTNTLVNANYSSGVYVVKVTTADKTVSRKIVL